MSKKDNYNIKEGIFDRFRQLWSREQEADQSDPQGDTSPPEITGPINQQSVNISLPYAGTGEQALADPEVKKLIQLFQADMEINHSATVQDIQQLIKINPTDAINFMIRQSGVNLGSGDGGAGGDGGQGDPQKGTLSKEVPLSMTKRQKSTQPGEGKPAEVPLNSFMQKKLGLPPRAVNMIVKNITQTLKSRGINVAENKINSVVKNLLIERLAYTKKDFDKLRNQLEKINKQIETEKDSSSRKFLERSKLDIEEKIKRMEADLGLQKSAIKGAKDKKRKDYSDRKKAMEKQGAKYGAAGKIIYKYAARQAQKDPAFMKAFGDSPQQQNKVVRSVEKVLRRMLRRRGYTDQEVKNALKESLILQENLTITNLSETDVTELVSEINKFYPYAKEYLGFDRPVELTLISDPDNAKDTFGKTAYYTPTNEQMTIFVDGRHPKDIIRSFSHELVHHAQNCRGEFDREFNVGENYIETDDHLREMEREAYDKGNMCLRTYESYLKKENKTMNEETLRKSIREAIKRVVENKEKLEEGSYAKYKRDPMEEDTVTEDSGEEEAWHQWKNEHADDDHIKEIEHHLRALKSDRDYERDEAEYDHDDYEDDRKDEGRDAAEELGDDVDREKGLPSVTSPKVDYMKEETLEETGAKKTGASQGDKGKDKEDPEDRDYSGHGERKDDESDTHPDEKDDTTKKGDELKHSGEGRGEKKGDKAYINEEETTTSLNESLAAKKGQLVFDKLVKKWCK